jgi:hypothetical protein
MFVEAKFLRGWIGKFLIAGIGIAVAATLPLGSSTVLAAGSKPTSASRLLSAACRTTLAAPAVRAHGHLTTNGQAITMSVYFGSAGDLMTLTQNGNQTFSAIVDGPSTYIKGNRPFWQAATNSSSAASALAGRWIDMTADQKNAASITKNLNKQSLLSQCGLGGSATNVGHATVNGIKVTKVHQNGQGESNTYYIENGPTPYILRVTGSQSQKNSGDLVFADYGVQPDTAAPPGAVPISQFS